VNNHAISAIVGYEIGWGYTESMGASGMDMPVGMQALSSVGTTGMGVWGSDYHYAAWAALAQAQYSYKEKYVATASIRYDRTYKFAPKTRGGFFPGVSAAWIISKEPWMKDVQAFNLLKLRAGYGVTGNSDITAFLYQDSFATSNTYNDKVVALAERMPNDRLGWESAHMATIGLDMRLIDRINVTLDVYSTDNKNLLLDVPQAPSTGFTKYTANVGTVNNKGIEIAVDADIIKTKDWRWNLGANIGMNRNTVKYLPNGAFRRGFGTPLVEQIVSEGRDIYTWYMPEWAGVDPETGDPLWWVYEKETNADGATLYYVVDERGNPTSEKTTESTTYPVYTGNRETTNVYANADYRMVGSATPKFTGGMSTSLTWKNWSLGANLHFVYGNKIYNRERNTIDSDGSYIDYNMMSIENGLGWVRWDPEDESTHAIATHPRPKQNGNKKSNSVSSRYLEDGSFLRLQNITLAYNINKPIFNGVVKGGRIYFTADNVLTFTKFSGADPEVNLEGTSWSLAGMYSDNYPVPRSFVFGIDLKF
jgi:TonB-linked SusC/RagA family outer membrane protein